MFCCSLFRISDHFYVPNDSNPHTFQQSCRLQFGPYTHNADHTFCDYLSGAQPDVEDRAIAETIQWQAQIDFNGGIGFGYSIDSDGNTIAIGAIWDNDGKGAAYVYTQYGNTWIRMARLTAADGASDDYFGNSVSIKDSTVAVGAPFATVGGKKNAGAVYTFNPAFSWSEASATGSLMDKIQMYGWGGNSWSSIQDPYHYQVFGESTFTPHENDMCGASVTVQSRTRISFGCPSASDPERENYYEFIRANTGSSWYGPTEAWHPKFSRVQWESSDEWWGDFDAAERITLHLTQDVQFDHWGMVSAGLPNGDIVVGAPSEANKRGAIGIMVGATRGEDDIIIINSAVGPTLNLADGDRFGLSVAWGGVHHRCWCSRAPGQGRSLHLWSGRWGIIPRRHHLRHQRGQLGPVRV